MNWTPARIGKQYSFSASHQLTGVPAGHPCARLHGHNYIVEIECRGDIHPQTGFVVDFHKIDEWMKPIIKRLDHYHLNDIEGLENPTAENLAYWIWQQFDMKFPFSVTVWETPKAWAKYINTDGLWYKRDKVE
jgi:6-pyruvoyltetrahydropterin/6-carboxytetrahydropterin synthase